MEGQMDVLPELLETIEDGVATLTFNRPERLNALSTPIMEGSLHGLPRLAGDPAVKVVVLTGAGRAFCAGGDVKSMAEDRRAAEFGRGDGASALPNGRVAHLARAAEADDCNDQWTGRRGRARAGSRM